MWGPAGEVRETSWGWGGRAIEGEPPIKNSRNALISETGDANNNNDY